MKSLVVLDSIDSTQDEVTRRLKSGSPVEAVLAYEQTDGRGRFGRKWASPRDECLALSFAWHVATNWQHPELLSLAAGVVAAETFGVSIAWPNDLVVDTRKVGGILSEIVSCSLGKVPIIGLGINLTMTTPPGGVPWASSLVLEGRPRLLPLDAAAAFLERIESQPPPSTFHEIAQRWRLIDCTLGKEFRLNDGRVGIAQSVNGDGSLNLIIGDEHLNVTSAEALYGSGS